MNTYRSVMKLDIFYSGKIPLERIDISKDPTSSILLGVVPGNFPPHPTSVPDYLLREARRLHPESEHDTIPKAMQNLISLSFGRNDARANVNATNYDSTTAVRRLIKARNSGDLHAPEGFNIDEDLYSLARQIALFGFTGILMTPDSEAVIAKRSPSVQISGVYQSYPGGNMEYGSSLVETIWKETWEEGRIVESEVNETGLIGLTRSMYDAGNLGLVIYLKTRLRRKELRERITPSEHDPRSVQGIEFADGKSFMRSLAAYWKQSSGNSNGALLVLGTYIFGESYSRNLIEKLKKEFGVEINLGNPFNV